MTASTPSVPAQRAPTTNSASLALEAYERLAPFYDEIVRDYAYDRWLAAIDAIVGELGVPGRRLLDVACGTGRSFLPMLGRGWRIEACDISPAMVARARRNAPALGARICVADVRDLPWQRRFDLITFLDDSANYLVEDGDLLLACRSVARALVPGGLLVMDCNTLRTCRWLHERDRVVELGEAMLCWRASGEPDLKPDSSFGLRLDVFAADHDAGWRRESSVHWQRHHPRASVEACARRARLSVERVYGQRSGAWLDDELDEDVHPKALYFLRRPVPR
jgi:SAM-dependent methyltransferase